MMYQYMVYGNQEALLASSIHLLRLDMSNVLSKFGQKGCLAVIELGNMEDKQGRSLSCLVYVYI